VDLSRAFRNEDGVLVIPSGGRDIDMACALSPIDGDEVALEARFRMGD